VPFIYLTVVSSVLALILAVPVGLGTANFLSQTAPADRDRVLLSSCSLHPQHRVRPVGDLRAGGLAPPRRRSALNQTLGFLPRFSGPAYGIGMLAGGCILASWFSPPHRRVPLRDSRRAPSKGGNAWRWGDKWETISQVILPYARSGHHGRHPAGEDARGRDDAVTMVIGNRAGHLGLPFAPPTRWPRPGESVHLADYPLYLSALVEIALVLFGARSCFNARPACLCGRTRYRRCKGGVYGRDQQQLGSATRAAFLRPRPAAQLRAAWLWTAHGGAHRAHHGAGALLLVSIIGWVPCAASRP